MGDSEKKVPVYLRVRYIRSGFNPKRFYPHYELSVPRKLVEEHGIAPRTRFYCYYLPDKRSFVFVVAQPDQPGRSEDEARGADRTGARR